MNSKLPTICSGDFHRAGCGNLVTTAFCDKFTRDDLQVCEETAAHYAFGFHWESLSREVLTVTELDQYTRFVIETHPKFEQRSTKALTRCWSTIDEAQRNVNSEKISRQEFSEIELEARAECSKVWAAEGRLEDEAKARAVYRILKLRPREAP